MFSRISVRLGEHSINEVEDCQLSPTGQRQCAPPVKDIIIEERIKHKEYSRDDAINDIALLRLSESVPLNNPGKLS